jgi:hypothetical protein
MFYPAASCGGKSVWVRQLRGPHLSTWPWFVSDVNASRLLRKREDYSLTPSAPIFLKAGCIFFFNTEARSSGLLPLQSFGREDEIARLVVET